MLGAGAREPRPAIDPCPDASAGAAAAARSWREPLGARRLCAGRSRRRTAGDAARHRLRSRHRQGVAAAVVSMPCWALFEQQDEAYRRAVLGSAPRVGVEAAVEFGWNRYLGD